MSNISPFQLINIKKSYCTLFKKYELSDVLNVILYLPAVTARLSPSASKVPSAPVSPRLLPQSSFNLNLISPSKSVTTSAT